MGGEHVRHILDEYGAGGQHRHDLLVPRAPLATLRGAQVAPEDELDACRRVLAHLDGRGGQAAVAGGRAAAAQERRGGVPGACERIAFFVLFCFFVPVCQLPSAPPPPLSCVACVRVVWATLVDEVQSRMKPKPKQEPKRVRVKAKKENR